MVVPSGFHGARGTGGMHLGGAGSQVIKVELIQCVVSSGVEEQSGGRDILT